MTPDSGERAILIAALRQNARIWLWFAVPLLVIGAAALAIWPVVRDRLAGISGLILALVGGLFLRPVLRDPRRHQLIRALENETPGELQEVDVVYTQYGSGSPEPVLHVKLAHGGSHEITLRLGTEKPLLAALKGRLSGG